LPSSPIAVVVVAVLVVTVDSTDTTNTNQRQYKHRELLHSPKKWTTAAAVSVFLSAVPSSFVLTSTTGVRSASPAVSMKKSSGPNGSFAS
jgi:hypothetical protein